MDENPIELQDPLQPDPPVEPAPPVEPLIDTELETTKKENELLKQKNAQLFERTKKAEEKAKAPSGSEVDFLETAKVAKKYDEDVLEIIAGYAKRTGMTIAQAEKDEVVQLAIEAKKEKVAKEKAIPIPSGTSGATNYKAVEQMTREEHQRYEAESLQRKKGNSNT
jgi:hypothetical protein